MFSEDYLLYSKYISYYIFSQQALKQSYGVRLHALEQTSYALLDLGDQEGEQNSMPLGGNFR